MSLDDRLAKWAEKQLVLGGQGWIRVVDTMGDDGTIVETARVTTGRGRSQHEWPSEPGADGRFLCKTCKTVRVWNSEMDEWCYSGDCLEGDRRFLDYMMAHRHTSPFEFAEVTLHVRCPMDVWRQWIRHRTANVSEYSTRYSRAINERLTTPPGEWRAQAAVNRQGSAGTVTEWPPGWTVFTPPKGFAGESGDTVFDEEQVGRYYCEPGVRAQPGAYLTARESVLHDLAREVYEERLSFGVAREQARKDLPLSTFTEAYWKVDLHNLLHFLSLRTDGHAQQEIREYADVIAQFVEEWCPMIFAAWVEHRRDAVMLSASQVRALREALGGVREALPNMLPAAFAVALDEAGVTGRARADFLRKLGLT